jgi:hypothetical protein
VAGVDRQASEPRGRAVHQSPLARRVEGGGGPRVGDQQSLGDPYSRVIAASNRSVEPSRGPGTLIPAIWDSSVIDEGF